MIASAQTLRRLQPVEPFCERTVFEGMSYGVSSAGYDVRLDDIQGSWFQDAYRLSSGRFLLGSTLERFKMPNNLVGIVHDKSTLIRKGLSVFNTVIEPGWEGYLTVELKNNGMDDLILKKGQPIAQIIFHYLDEVTDQPYVGKYNNQEKGPQAARFE